MKRINIVYGGATYSIGNQDIAGVEQEISAALRSEVPYWLVVNHGEGLPREARLLITPGVHIALIPAPELDQNTELFTDEPVPPPARSPTEAGRAAAATDLFIRLKAGKSEGSTRVASQTYAVIRPVHNGD